MSVPTACFPVTLEVEVSTDTYKVTLDGGTHVIVDESENVIAPASPLGGQIITEFNNQYVSPDNASNQCKDILSFIKQHEAGDSRLRVFKEFAEELDKHLTLVFCKNL